MDKEYRNEYEIRMFTLGRSGHSAISLWLAYLFEEPIYYFNNVHPFRDPFIHSSTTRNYRKTVIHTKIMSKHKCFVTYGSGGQKKYLSKVEKIREKNKKCIMYAYEDFDIKRLAEKPIVEEQWVGKSKNIYELIVIRDIFNLTASRRKGKKVWTKKWYFDRWNDHAREALGETNYLTNKIIINYNKWFSDIGYRKNIASTLSLKFSDKGLNSVQPYKRGSSFNQTKYDGRAQDMKVLERWKRCIDRPMYRYKMKRHKTSLKLAKKLFPQVYKSFMKEFKK